MRFHYSVRANLKTQQQAFVRTCMGYLPDHVEAKLRALPVDVYFKPFTAIPGYRSSCIYYHEGRDIYLPQSYWKDQQTLAKWIKQLNQATFIHETFHGFDMNALMVEQRDSLLAVLTGYETNGHDLYYGVSVPKHSENGVLRASWISTNWGQSAAELFADTGVETFAPNLPPHDRAPEALKVSDAGKAALVEILSG